MKYLKILEMITKDMETNAEELDGKPFNCYLYGRTMGEAFRKQGAAIAALANIIKERIEKEST